MANCMICGRNEADRKPMALIGKKEFGMPAPSGYKWKDGRQPVTRIWKVFALVDVTMCPSCIKKQFRNRILKKTLIGCACALAAVPLYTFFSKSGALPTLLSLLGLGLSIAAAVNLFGLFRFIEVKNSEKFAGAFLSQYRKAPIPKEIILTVPAGQERFQQEGIDLKKDTAVVSPYDEKNKSHFNLLLFSPADLYRVGGMTKNRSTMNYTEEGLDEAQTLAKELFEKIGVKFDL